jgi:OOP family OmpA-OmpF porin
MSFNLVDAAKGLFPNELIGKASSYLGESESGLSKAISGIIPSILGGVAEKATSSPTGAASITDLARESDDSGFLGNLGGFFENDGGGLLNRGAGMLNGLFGEGKSNLLSTVISQFSGIKSSSANSLLGLAVPAILGMLGRHVKSNNMDAGGLSSLLSSQKSNIMNAVPAGLNLGSVFSGWGTRTADVVPDVHTKPTHYVQDSPEDSGGGMKLLVPILLLALLGAAVWYFTKDGCGSKDHTATTTHSDTAAHDNIATAYPAESATGAMGRLDTATGDFVYDMGESVAVTLPNNGGNLTVGRNSTEYKLVQFLNDNNAMIDTVKGNWFEFTNVRFKSGGSDITDESMTQLRNLVTIAKAYPNAQFKIGGYTDNTGNASANVALSQKRANAVSAKLKELGIAAAAITGAEGYGQEWPIASNDTPEGRAQNRRVAVNVKSK